MTRVNTTKALLLNVPLENDYKHTLYFTSKDEQEEYFKSRMVRTYNDFSYQRKDEPIRISTVDSNGLVSEYDDLIKAGVNYVMYQNSYYTDKWFYAFITDIKYISDGIVEIQIETDHIQTWLFDYRVKASFVEREHVSDDTIGKHTVPEGLETGPYVTLEEGTINLSELDYIVIATTQTFATNSEGKMVGTDVSGGLYGNCYSGVKYLAYSTLEYQKVNKFLEDAAEAGGADAIVAIFLAPSFVVEEFLNEDNTIKGSNIPASKEVQIEKNTSMLDNYSPHNKKLLTSPFNYLLVSNNSGSSATYSYEDFKHETFNDHCVFAIYGVLCPGCSIKLVPSAYKGGLDLQESINAGKFPICNWNTDVYTNWLTQNSTNIALSQLSGYMQIGAGVIGGVMTGGLIGLVGGLGAVGNGAMQITQTMAEVKKQALTPPQAEGNLNCGDVVSAMAENNFSYYKQTIKGEYAQMIDKYFDMFGYKVNMVKVPNKAHRSRYWYTKTIDVNIDGAIPNKDMQAIKNCYNNGITFWRSATEIQNYALDNSIAITEGAVTE